MELGTFEFIITVFGLVFTAYATYDIWKHKMIDDFRANFNSLSYNRSFYASNMRRAYGEMTKDECRVKSDAHLLKPANDDGTWEPDKCVRITLGDDTDVLIEAEPGMNRFRGVEFTEGRFHRQRFLLYRICSFPNPFRLYSYNCRRYIGKKVFDGTLYHVISVSNSNGKISLKVGVSSYYSAYNSCEVLTYMAVYHQNRELEGRWKLKEDWRSKRATRDLCIDIFDLKNRCVGIGVCTLTVFTNVNSVEGNNYFLIHHRSDKVSEAMNTVSLVPAGSFQPNYDQKSVLEGNEPIDRNDDLYLNILREFEEEVLGRKEAEFADDFNADRIEGIDTYYLTMGLDPLTTKMEMATMLTIDCKEPAVIRYIGGLVSEIDTDKLSLSKDDIMAILEHASSEGRITMEPFTERIVTRYESYSEAMPIFRECMRYVKTHANGCFNNIIIHDLKDNNQTASTKESIE